ncbi:peptidylprolyl isomerase [Synechococcus sp. WC10meta]|uniref:peptidylprolyl isomerase n=1 Tax=Synechococcus sp. WC10meta TaxID=2964537 RepID=UPI0039C2CC2D
MTQRAQQGSPVGSRAERWEGGRKSLRLVLAAVLLWAVWLGGIPALALPQGDAITDPRTLLRRALPIQDSRIWEIDEAITKIEADLKYNRWSAVRGDVRQVERLLDRYTDPLLAELPPEQAAAASEEIAALRQELQTINQATERKPKGKEEARAAYDRLVDKLGSLESKWVGAFPYEIPQEYADRPQLLGRAEVELNTTAGRMVITLDGYSAPITAGNFADLVQRGFYDGLTFDRVEKFFLVQAGDPPGPADGYVDPATGKVRTIPLEIRAKGELMPRYGQTFEQLGLWDVEPALPFSAEGTVAMARYLEDPNSASSQFFIFMAEPDLTPAGLNLMDGRYAVFGYVTEGTEVLRKIKLGDRILSARIISGKENLKNA